MMAKQIDPAPGTPEYEAGLEFGRQLREQIVEKIQAIIRQRDLTQKQIAAMAGMTQQAASQFMSKPGSPINFDRLLTLMANLGMTWELREPDGSTKLLPVKPPRKKKTPKKKS